MLIDLLQYKPKLLIDEAHNAAAPPQLGMEDLSPDPAPQEPPLQEMLDMAQAEAALNKPVHLPPKAQFTDGPSVHVQFDGGA